MYNSFLKTNIFWASEKLNNHIMYLDDREKLKSIFKLGV